MNRAYSLLALKSVNDEKRILTGIATTPSTDRSGDIVESNGAEFDLPIPFLWQHDSDQPIGHVTKAKVTNNGIEVEVQIQQTDEPGAVKDRLDSAWQDIKLGLVRGLSIGFTAIEYARIAETYSYRYLKWLWLELSAVTIPANGDCSIQTIKSIDAPLLAATGKEPKASDRPAPPGVTGKSLKSVKILPPKEGKEVKKTIAEQISAFEATRQAKQARMDEIMDNAADKGETLDAAQKEEYDTLEGEVKEVDEHLTRLRAREKSAVSTAKPVAGTSPEVAARARDVATVRVVPESLPKGLAFARLAKVKALAKLDGESATQIAKNLYGEESSVYRLLTKAAVAAGSAVSGNWAVNLVSDETSVFAEFLEFLRPMTIVGKFGTGNIPSLNNVPFDTPLITQTGGGAAYWVGEGKPKPLTNFNYSRTTLAPLKVATIAVVTEELLRRSSIAAETNLRDELAKAVAARVDTDFIDPAKTASAGVSPASVTNGVSAVHSSGNDADAIREDVRALLGTFIAANNPPTSGVWIMSSLTALGLSLMKNALGQDEFPAITMNGGVFQGLPAITSEYLGAVTAGGYVALANANNIWFADEGGVAVDMSREASLEMKDSSLTQDAVAGTGTSLVSLWQTNSVGFRAERILNWAKARSSAVAVLDQVNWGQPTG